MGHSDPAVDLAKTAYPNGEARECRQWMFRLGSVRSMQDGAFKPPELLKRFFARSHLLYTMRLFKTSLMAPLSAKAIFANRDDLGDAPEMYQFHSQRIQHYSLEQEHRMANNLISEITGQNDIDPAERGMD